MERQVKSARADSHSIPAPSAHERAAALRFGMAHQIAALVLLSLIVFGTITGVIIRTQYTESLRRDLVARGESIAIGISKSLRHGYIREDKTHLSSLLNEFSHIHGVAYIGVVGRDGALIAQHPDGDLFHGLALFGASEGREEGVRVRERGGLLDVAIPVELGPMASVHVGMNLGVVERSIENVTGIVWRIVLVSILCAMSVAVIVYFRTIRPFHVLTESVRQIGQGTFAGRIPLGSGGEMGILARSLEQMNADLAGYHEQLETKTREIESSKEELQRQNEELKRAQAQMIRSEKFSSMGQLAASVAHEISNPLAGILTYLKLIRRRMEKGPVVPEQQETFRQYLLTMERETERCGHIVKNLLDFARSSEPDLRDIDIHRVLEDTIFLLNFKLLMNHVVLEKDYGEVPAVAGDFGQLKQVFLNVIINAVEAMKGEDRRLRINTRFHRESQTVLVEIQDTGDGISEANIYKVFDPFFTTKPGGTGMGLAVVYGIIEKHNADISIDSQRGKGTKVTIQLIVARPEGRRGPTGSGLGA
jgi:signal transduction histidine kinase